MSDLMHKNLNALDEEALKDVNGGAAIAAAGTITDGEVCQDVTRIRIWGKRKTDIGWVETYEMEDVFGKGIKLKR